MSQSDDVARLAEAVSGLEQAIGGIAAILEGHGELLARLLEAAEEKPPDESETAQGTDWTAGSAARHVAADREGDCSGRTNGEPDSRAQAQPERLSFNCQITSREIARLFRKNKTRTAGMRNSTKGIDDER